MIAAFKAWLSVNRARVSAKAPLGEALKYIGKYWDGLCLFLTDGRIESARPICSADDWILVLFPDLRYPVEDILSGDCRGRTVEHQPQGR